MWNKKGIFDVLLYFSLLASVFRIDDYNHHHSNNEWDNFLSVSRSYGSNNNNNNYGETDIYSIYELRRPHPYLDSPSKTSILIDETYDLFRELNSLGRYSSSTNAYNTQLFAYLVNNDETSRNQATCVVPPTPSSSGSGSSSSPSANTLCSATSHPLSEFSLSGDPVLHRQPLSPESTTSSILSDEERRSETQETSGFNSGLSSQSSDSSGVITREDVPLNGGSNVGPLDLLNDDLSLSSNDDLLDEVLFSGIDLPLISDPLLSSIINDDNGDDALFEELEKLILNTEEGNSDQGPMETGENRWDTGAWNTDFEAAASVETPSMLQQEVFYPNFYQYGSSYHPYAIGDQLAEAQAENVAQASAGFITASSGGPGAVNSIATAVAASMATLTNGSEPVPDICSSVTGYGAEFSNFSYPNGTSTNNITVPGAGIHLQNPTGEYSLSDFLTDEDLQLMDVSNAIQETYNAAAAAAAAHNQKPQVVTTTNATEDRMDASSDSAVSSMSSDRVPSISEGDWIDTCSENSSHHGDQSYANYSGGHYESRAVAAAQKKYKLFGKKTEFKQEQVENVQQQPAESYERNSYYENVDYGYHDNSAYASTAEGAYGYATGASNQIATYVPVPLRNHTYHLQVPHRQVEQRELTKAALGVHNRKESTTRSLSSSHASENFSDDDDDDSNDCEYVTGRDEKRARALKIPISTYDIVNLPIDEFNERIAKYELTEAQLSLIRDIRRRGKNKVAAQNCRKRKMDQILGLQGEVDALHDKKAALLYQRDQLISYRDLVREKYAKLYNLVLESSRNRNSGSTMIATGDYGVQKTNYTNHTDNKKHKPVTKR